MDLIDRKALGIGKANPLAFEKPEYADGWNSAVEIIQNAPAVDAVPVVRCKDCKWYMPGDIFIDTMFCHRLKKGNGKPAKYVYCDDDYCSYGERKTDG